MHFYFISFLSNETIGLEPLNSREGGGGTKIFVVRSQQMIYVSSRSKLVVITDI